MMSNEREQIESQGQPYKATPDARISRTDEGGAEPHPSQATEMHRHRPVLHQRRLEQTICTAAVTQKRDNAFNCPGVKKRGKELFWKLFYNLSIYERVFLTIMIKNTFVMRSTILFAN